MSKFISAFTDPPQGRLAENPWWKFGFLALCVSLLILQIVWFVDAHAIYPGNPYIGFIAPLLLILNHLAFQFKFKTRVTVFMRILALVWVVVGSVYIYLQVL